MDNLAKQLREDANSIDCQVSDQLDRRIRASLEGTAHEVGAQSERGAHSQRFWWASSLTGVAAAAAVIALVNVMQTEPESAVTEPAPQALVIPSINWRAETAVLISPLEQEAEHLQSDLKKAEEALRQDIERLF